jgi:hypothetical protein
VAADTSSSSESAIWWIAYGTGYRHGRSDAGNVLRRGLAEASVGYQAGYERGTTGPSITQSRRSHEAREIGWSDPFSTDEYRAPPGVVVSGPDVPPRRRGGSVRAGHVLRPAAPHPR